MKASCKPGEAKIYLLLHERFPGSLLVLALTREVAEKETLAEYLAEWRPLADITLVA